MPQHFTAHLNADNVEFEEKIRFRGASTDQAENSGDSSWEDEDNMVDRLRNASLHRPGSPASASSTRQTPKHKRRKPHFATNRRNDRIQASLLTSPSPKPTSPPPKPPRQRRTVLQTDLLLDGIQEFSIFIVRYAWDVTGRAFQHSRYILGFFLSLWILSLFALRIASTLWGAVAPVCYLPIISSSRMCETWHNLSVQVKQTPRWADYPKMVDLQSKTFEQLIDDSIGGSALSLEVKKAEMAITDLVTVVRLSKLKAKDTLAGSLIEFVQDARKAGRGLQKLSSKIGGAVDNIMAVNDYALQQIDAAQTNQPSSLYALIPWKSPRKSVNEVVVETFGEAMNILSTDMERLIIEAEANIIALDTLEEQLSTLHAIISREDLTLSSEKEDLLAELWTKLGFNRNELRNFNQSLMLLKDLKTYRRQALARVVAALQTLNAMSADMEDLRERVARPALADSKIPVDVHMKSIKLGLERLREGRVRAKELDEAAIRQVMSMNDIDDD